MMLFVSQQALAGNIFHVNSASGKNQNDGSQATPFKNIQKAVDVAADGDTILVAEGNYFGTLDKGSISIGKAVTIVGGYAPDFSTRDVLKHLTMVQPTAASNGTAGGGGTMQIKVDKPDTAVVIDGLIFDRGNTIGYNAKGEGKPEGVESSMMNPIGTGGIGGPDLTTADVKTVQSTVLYLDGKSDFTIKNCVFANSPYYGILGGTEGKKVTISNNVFINNRFAAVEVGGKSAKHNTEIFFTYNTVLFSWSRLKDYKEMGYGFRYMTKSNAYVQNNIIGLSIFAGLDRARMDTDKKKEAERITTAENNIFFLNKQCDLAAPGGGMFMRINVEQFADFERLAKSSGNKALADPAVFKGIINEPYLNGFLAASYSETTNVDRNSPANLFRAAMGMNIQGTMKSSASMFANRYPWKEALRFFGAMEGYGAQAIKN